MSSKKNRSNRLVGLFLKACLKSEQVGAVEVGAGGDRPGGVRPGGWGREILASSWFGAVVLHAEVGLQVVDGEGCACQNFVIVRNQSHIFLTLKVFLLVPYIK